MARLVHLLVYEPFLRVWELPELVANHVLCHRHRQILLAIVHHKPDSTSPINKLSQQHTRHLLTRQSSVELYTLAPWSESAHDLKEHHGDLGTQQSKALARIKQLYSNILDTAHLSMLNALTWTDPTSVSSFPVNKYCHRATEAKSLSRVTWLKCISMIVFQVICSPTTTGVNMRHSLPHALNVDQSKIQWPI